MKKRMLIALVLAALLLAMLPEAMAADSIRINTDVRMDSDGAVTISWSDLESGYSYYTVYYEYISSSGYATQSKILCAMTSSKSTTVNRLIPGAKYRIYVSDLGSREASAVIRVPSKGNVSSKRKMAIKVIPKYRTDKWGEAKTLKTMSASAMERNINKGYQYGIDYQTTYYSSGSRVEHMAVFALYAPNGYVWSGAGDFTLPYMDSRYANVKSYYGFLGGEFFDGLLEENGEIPTGTYKLEIYLEGRFYKSATFKVTNLMIMLCNTTH